MFRKDSPFRSSIRAKLNSLVSPSPPVEHDAKACYESFRNHWQQAWDLMRQTAGGQQAVPMTRAAMSDQISAVLNHLDQMMVLLLHDISRTDESIGPLLDLVLTEDILNKLLSWSLKSGEFTNTLKLEQLKLYETLITQSRQEVLVHKPILQPLLSLLSTCGECSPVEVEKRLVILLNQLCVSLTHNATLLEFFFNADCNQGPAKFLIFSLLIPFVHREGGIGQQARDALLLCMALSRKNDRIGIYIAEHSTFCPVLATGLSGLYSVLPRKITFETDDWHRFTQEDINDIPDLAMFLNSLEFCNAVIQVSHPLVQKQLLEFLYQGFLSPVLVPALQPPAQQVCNEELATATAYLILFLRTTTEPPLLRAFLKMLLMERSDGPPLIDSLVVRIASQYPLGLVTLSLFHTLLDLNCEDVMLELVFKYLIPCTHVMVSQRCRVRDVDMFGKSAEKFLSLMPMCCMPPPIDDSEHTDSDPSSLESNAACAAADKTSSLPRVSSRRRQRNASASSFSPGDFYEHFAGLTSVMNPPVTITTTSLFEYLLEARRTVTATYKACRCWAWPYDGEQPPPDVFALKATTNGMLLIDSSPDNENRTGNVSETLKSSVELNARNFSANGGNTGDERLRSESPEHKDLLSFYEDITDDFYMRPPCGKEFANQRSSLDASTLSDRRHSDDDDFGANGKAASTVQSLSRRQSSDTSTRTQLPNLSLELGYTVTAGTFSPSDGFGSPDLGPFLSILLSKLENMMSNSVYENLQLTGVIARLASYPQPLLRSFLLNHSLVFQPSVRSLLQVLGTLKQKLDSFFYTLDNIDDLLIRARRFLLSRDERFSMENGTTKAHFSKGDRRFSTPEGFNRGESKRLSITDRLFRRSPLEGYKNARISLLENISNETGYRYVKPKSPETSNGKLETLRTKNAVLCVVVLEEFLKELSAIAMEHAVVDEEIIGYDFMWQ